MSYVKWEDLKVGDKLVFRGYSNPDHSHWSFKVGEEYTVGVRCGSIGPRSDRGTVAGKNWGFNFERVEEGTVSELKGSDLKEGDVVVYLGEARSRGTSWNFKVGHDYRVGYDRDGDFGVIDGDGDAFSLRYVGEESLFERTSTGNAEVKQESPSLEDLLRELQEALTGTDLSVTVDSGGFSMFDGLCNIQSPHNMDAEDVAKIIEAQSTYVNMTKDWL